MNNETNEPANILLAIIKARYEAAKKTNKHIEGEIEPFAAPENLDELLLRLEDDIELETRNILPDGKQMFRRDIFFGMLEEMYDETNHQEVHQKLLDYICWAHQDNLAGLLALNIRTFDVLALKIHVLAYCMKKYEWDGFSPWETSPNLNTPEYRWLLGALMEDLFMMSQHVPQKYIDQLDELLRSEDRQIILATLSYLRGWMGSGGTKDLSLIRIRPFIKQYWMSSDLEIKTRAEEVNEYLDKLSGQ